MKLLVYSHAFAPQVGGVETFAMYLARDLAASEPGKFNVTVITQTNGRGDGHDALESFSIVRNPRAGELWQRVRETDMVLLAGPAILPLLFALLQRKRVVVTHHGYQSICPNGMLFHLPTQSTCPGHFASGRYLECVKCNTAEEGAIRSARLLVLTFVRRVLSRLADLNVAVSEHVRQRIALPQTQVIRNGVPDFLALPEAPRVFTDQPHSFAFVGRLVTEKGVPVLVEAASVLKKRGRDFRILIIGDGPQRTALQARVASLNLDQQVVFLGFLMGAELEEAMAGVSALVMPSICEDAAPFSVLEQMMQGRLIIGSDLGGLAEEIGDSGLTFAAGDAHALAAQMERVIEHPELIARLGRMARERAVESYTLHRMLDEYRALTDAE